MWHSRRIKTLDGHLDYVLDSPSSSAAYVEKPVCRVFPLTGDPSHRNPFPFCNDRRTSIYVSGEWQIGRLMVPDRGTKPPSPSPLTGFDCPRPQTTIEMLLDEVLLEIFDFYRIANVQSLRGRPWRWKKLVHVCRRWRHVIYASPLRLDLQLSCSYGTPVRTLLGCWPPLPLAIQYGGLPGRKPPALEDEDDIIAALQHPERIWKIELTVTNSLSGKLESLLQKPFPILSHLEISQDNTGWVLPSVFLGRSTPRLAVIYLYEIAFPALTTLHLSVNAVTSLGLVGIPSHGYFSPHEIATCLSMLTHLESFSILFQSPIPRHVRGIIPLKLARLHALTSFGFRGTSEYLEDLVAQIDAPYLAHISIKFFHQLVFEIPQLSSFIGRAKRLKFLCNMILYSTQGGLSTSLTRPTSTGIYGQLNIEISCKRTRLAGVFSSPNLRSYFLCLVLRGAAVHHGR
ncbi:hypothetical protein F5148DRAFT_326589 [Russula earlei]|uniref:Uncharacterized protein n=1 Tax=Russula earlei TaxID=71964 RepID=A0ACC0UJI5_9AGAM|nr:hypothetical protein F5148DRAFT_326589 [Russula earlei]